MNALGGLIVVLFCIGVFLWLFTNVHPFVGLAFAAVISLLFIRDANRPQGPGDGEHNDG